MNEVEGSWVPEVCLLPTAELPLRQRQFDELFATSLWGSARVSPTVLRWSLDPAVESRARDLAARETECCSFFDFTFSRDEAALQVDVRVPAAQVQVLDGLAERYLVAPPVHRQSSGLDTGG